MYTIASSISDLNSYRTDIEQFKFLHQFDLQHRLSISTIGETQSNNKIGQNINSYKSQSDHHLNFNSHVWRNRQVIKTITKKICFSKISLV
jgi:hypothetical protein